MLHLLAFALLLHGALSIEQCKNGEEIIPKETKNPLDIIGSWKHVYHWDSYSNFSKEFVEELNQSPDCSELKIEEISPDLVKAKKEECAKEKIPFNWADAKLKVDAPVLGIKEGLLILGEKENWIMEDCITMVRVVLRKVREDYILMTNPDISNTSELVSKVEPSLEELKSVVHNLDIVKGVSGLGVCYNK
uniref:Lipocalin/cytosolic fatty-acid binding domain-containing protein n=1 Tax=Heliothis virescens TaxID=7102 RepID=A0A2A4JFR7_HELVI